MDRVRCSECGEAQYICPECGGSKVMPNEDLQTPSVQQWVTELTEPGEHTLTIEDVCWECGWSQEKTITVEVSAEK